MLSFAILFLLGDVILQQFNSLPNCYIVFAVFPLLFFLILKIKKLKILAGLICGFVWAFSYAYFQLAWKLPENLEGKTIQISGYIASIPATAEHTTHFTFSMRELNAKRAHSLVKLSWRDAPHLTMGDQWQLSVRLKQIHGLRNPGSFDYEAWALQERIRAQGYIINKDKNIQLSHSWLHSPLGRIRQTLKENIETHLPASMTSAWIVALAVGERQGIAPEKWEVLRNTGTNHLMAIAGLHVGFMAGFAFALVSWLWRQRWRWALRFPAPLAGAIAALCMALVYSAMAGFSIPTQRACVMLVIFLVVKLLRRKNSVWQAWSLALVLVLLINPLDVLTESFWLSFGSVALIIYGVSGRLNPKGWWWKWGRIQWVVAVGLIPLSIWLFQQCSIVAFLANSIAIPWVGFIIVPSILCGSFLFLFSNTAASWVLIFADKNLNVLWNILEYFSHLSWSAWYHSVTALWILFSACVGVILLLVPKGFPGRYFGLIGLFPLFFYQPIKPKSGEVWFTLLDVGQGLAAVVQTQNHLLVFDAGPRLSESYDMGASVIAPFLRTLATKKLDMLVISHGDNDHIGGAEAILKQFSVDSIKTSVPAKFLPRLADYCIQDLTWNWDQVDFTFLYPPTENLAKGNDSSCVLKISVGQQAILLTGDIEKLAEKYLVENKQADLSATILVAPHHGSKTSAERAFVNAVHPQVVLFPIGYRNRYHFPHPTVIEKYQRLAAQRFDSVSGGAIQFKLALTRPQLSKPTLYRLAHLRYWNHEANNH